MGDNDSTLHAIKKTENEMTIFLLIALLLIHIFVMENDGSNCCWHYTTAIAIIIREIIVLVLILRERLSLETRILRIGY